VGAGGASVVLTGTAIAVETAMAASRATTKFFILKSKEC
jgi:hypothetical protein